MKPGGSSGYTRARVSAEQGLKKYSDNLLETIPLEIKNEFRKIKSMGKR